MITIIDYQAGNIRSLTNALDRLGADYQISSDPQAVRSASKLIFPGQGAAGAGMAALKASGLTEPLQACTVPFLGICLGLQLLFDQSEEGGASCLGVLPGGVQRFRSADLPVPQVGWNVVKTTANNKLFQGIPDESYFYFVHSFAAPLTEVTTAVSFYDGLFTAAVQKENFYGVQFHPEKSGAQGQRLLRNFLEL